MKLVRRHHLGIALIGAVSYLRIGRLTLAWLHAPADSQEDKT